jgi:hypothetical protein
MRFPLHGIDLIPADDCKYTAAFIDFARTSMPTTIRQPQTPHPRESSWITVRVWNDGKRLRLSQDIDDDAQSNNLRAVIPILLELRDKLLDFQGPPYDEIVGTYEDILARHQRGETFTTIADHINEQAQDDDPAALWQLSFLTDNPTITAAELKERARDWHRKNKMHRHLLEASKREALDCHCKSCHNPDSQPD